MSDFYAKLADILEVDEVKPESVLREFENWDSLTALSIIAMADSDFGVSLGAADLRQLKTAGELAAFVDSRKKK